MYSCNKFGDEEIKQLTMDWCGNRSWGKEGSRIKGSMSLTWRAVVEGRHDVPTRLYHTVRTLRTSMSKEHDRRRLDQIKSVVRRRAKVCTIVPVRSAPKLSFSPESQAVTIALRGKRK